MWQHHSSPSLAIRTVTSDLSERGGTSASTRDNTDCSNKCLLGWVNAAKQYKEYCCIYRVLTVTPGEQHKSSRRSLLQRLWMTSWQHSTGPCNGHAGYPGRTSRSWKEKSLKPLAFMKPENKMRETEVGTEQRNRQSKNDGVVSCPGNISESGFWRFRNPWWAWEGTKGDDTTLPWKRELRGTVHYCCGCFHKNALPKQQHT